jgi:lipid A 3-O-deacylase
MDDSFLKPLIGCLLFALTTHASADSFSNAVEDFKKAQAQGKATTILSIDNDSLLLNKNDGFYTSGVQIDQKYALRDSGRTAIFGWRIGQELYTPSDIKLPPQFVGPPDHPYAGWLYGGFFKEVRADDGTHTKIGVDVGCLGPCAGGKWTQTNLHHLLNQPLPQGWSKQVKNELGVVLYADVAPVRWTFGSSVDLTPNLHGRFGNIYTDAGAGITLRAGQLNALSDNSTLHGFMRVDANVIGYNATLQGGYFSNDNPHTVKPKRLVGEAEIGVAWNKGPYGASASVVQRSNEISGLSNSIGTQNFVRLLFSYTP